MSVAGNYAERGLLRQRSRCLIQPAASKSDPFTCVFLGDAPFEVRQLGRGGEGRGEEAQSHP
jgi:hypothetical protein